MRLLPNAGIGCTRTANIGFEVRREEEADQLDKIMRGPGPVVFVKGRAKNNPDLAAIIAEFRQSADR